MKIAMASDHAGFDYKELLKEHLSSKKYEVIDFGTYSHEPVDYPLFIKPAAQAVARGYCDLGIILGGSGNGEAIAANKIRGIRCAVCWNTESARLAREHNNANIISLGQRLISVQKALKIVDTWIAAKFQGGRHSKRIELIE